MCVYDSGVALVSLPILGKGFGVQKKTVVHSGVADYYLTFSSFGQKFLFDLLSLGQHLQIVNHTAEKMGMLWVHVVVWIK